MSEGESPPIVTRRGLLKAVLVGGPSLAAGAALDHMLGSTQKSIEVAPQKPADAAPQKPVEVEPKEIKGPYEKAEEFLQNETALLSSTRPTLDELATNDPFGGENPQVIALKAAYADYHSSDIKVATWNSLIGAAIPEHTPVSNSDGFFTLLTDKIWRAKYEEKAKNLADTGSPNFMLAVQRPRNVDGTGGTVTDVVIVPSQKIDSDKALVIRHEALVSALATPNSQPPSFTEKGQLSAWLAPKLRAEIVPMSAPLSPSA
jgi:hypothetical protein